MTQSWLKSCLRALPLNACKLPGVMSPGKEHLSSKQKSLIYSFSFIVVLNGLTTLNVPSSWSSSTIKIKPYSFCPSHQKYHQVVDIKPYNVGFMIIFFWLLNNDCSNSLFFFPIFCSLWCSWGYYAWCECSCMYKTVAPPTGQERYKSKCFPLLTTFPLFVRCIILSNLSFAFLFSNWNQTSVNKIENKT